VSKLFKLKKWLTVAESATYLSLAFSETVTESDIYRLVLDRHLTLSANLVNYGYARTGRSVGIDDADFYMSDNLGLASINETIDKIRKERGEDPLIRPTAPHKIIRSVAIGENQYFKRDVKNDFTTIGGIWDLVMVGNNELNIEHMFQVLTGGPEITLTCLDGIFLSQPSGEVCELQVSVDENEYQTGSNAELREIHEQIGSGSLTGKNAKKALADHKEQRVEYLSYVKSKPEKDNYNPAHLMPQDAIYVLKMSSLNALTGKVGSGSVTDTTQRNYELAIGLLTKALADKAGANCGTQENPNISGLSELLQQYLPADDVGSLSNKALSISTLRKRLKTGYDSLKNS
jgi:hypothetical protein